MFAPKIVKPQTKPTANSTSNLSQQRSTAVAYPVHGPEHALFLHPNIGHDVSKGSTFEPGGTNRPELQFTAQEPQADLTRPPSLHLDHDFSRISIHPVATRAIQTKLAINKPGDSYEQEAERIAEQVMRSPEPRLPRACPCGGGCPNCNKGQPGGQHGSLQTKRVQAGDPGQIAAPPTVHKVLRSPGEPLDTPTRAFMEPRFGYDFSRVRVHSGEAAEKSVRDVNAHAYTVGHDIVFGANRFAPETYEGRRLLAHELAHVIQQSGAYAHVMHPLSPEGMGSQGQPPSRVSGMLALSHVAGNHAVSTILQRTPATGTPASSEPKVRERVEAFRRGMTRAQELSEIADRVIEQELGSRPNSLNGRRKGLDRIAARGGPQADVARRVGRALAEIEAEAAQVTSMVDDFIEGHLGARPKTPQGRENALRRLTEQGCAVCKQAADVERGLRDMEQELSKRQPRPPQTSQFADVKAPAAPDGKVNAKSRTVPATVTKQTAQVARTSGFRVAGQFLAREAPGLIFQFVAMALFPPNVNIHNDNIQKLSSDKLDSVIQDGLMTQEISINKMVADNPYQSVYANVTVDLVYKPDASHHRDLDLYLKDIRLLGMKISNERVLRIDPKFDTTVPRQASKQITYSILLYEALKNDYGDALGRALEVYWAF